MSSALRNFSEGIAKPYEDNCPTIVLFLLYIPKHYQLLNFIFMHYTASLVKARAKFDSKM